MDLNKFKGGGILEQIKMQGQTITYTGKPVTLGSFLRFFKWKPDSEHHKRYKREKAPWKTRRYWLKSFECSHIYQRYRFINGRKYRGYKTQYWQRRKPIRTS